MAGGVYGELTILSGNAHPLLASDICKYLDLPQGKVDVFKFRNDNTFVRILQNVRERDVFILQTFSRPVNDHIMEMLIMIDAAKRASAGRITAVIPHYAYGRSDKKDQPRVPITARLVADLLSTAGADRVLTIDLHASRSRNSRVRSRSSSSEIAENSSSSSAISATASLVRLRAFLFDSPTIFPTSFRTIYSEPFGGCGCRCAPERACKTGFC